MEIRKPLMANTFFAALVFGGSAIAQVYQLEHEHQHPAMTAISDEHSDYSAKAQHIDETSNNQSLDSTGETAGATIQIDVWTQADWDHWLQDLEAAYNSGMPEEMLYWWIETQLAALEAAESGLSVELPAPYPGWGDGGGPTPPGGPFEPQSHKGSGYGIQAPPCNPNVPGGCEAPVIVNPGTVDFADPATIQEIRFLGALLGAAGVGSGNVPTIVVGASLVAVAEGLELWVLETEDE